jgi:hypothetical protein
MNIRFRLQTVALVVFILIAGLAYAQHVFQMQAYDQPIEVLAQEVFEAQFGNNPQIPRSHEAIIALAERLYPPLTKKTAPAAPAKDLTNWCGEEDVGVLFAALQNPEVSDVTRRMVNDIIVAAIPPLHKRWISNSGHFQIFYTTDNPDPLHNVTRAQIKNLATLLDSYWDLFGIEFKEPKHKIVDGKKRIDVKVYYIDADTLGQTHSGWEHIELNSALCVRNWCQRRSTSTHELFHRVQYAYGLVSGTANMKWIVEGTAVWSEKFTNEGLRSYMYRMNKGLRVPEKALITERSYDATHFWVYLQEMYDSAIEEVWANYEVNGHDAKAAVDSVTTAAIRQNFDLFVGRWSLANYTKDLDNANVLLDYDEDEVIKTSCGVTYGPLLKVPVTTKTIGPDSTYTWIGSVKPYGSKYFVFNLTPTLNGVLGSFNGTGSFVVSIGKIYNNEYSNFRMQDTTSIVEFGGMRDSGFFFNKVAVVVTGAPTGGNFELKIDKCITGFWHGPGLYYLKDSGSEISGFAYPNGCEEKYNLKGSLDNGQYISFTATYPDLPPPSGCPEWVTFDNKILGSSLTCVNVEGTLCYQMPGGAYPICDSKVYLYKPHNP